MHTLNSLMQVLNFNSTIGLKTLWTFQPSFVMGIAITVHMFKLVMQLASEEALPNLSAYVMADFGKRWLKFVYCDRGIIVSPTAFHLLVEHLVVGIRRIEKCRCL